MRLSEFMLNSVIDESITGGYIIELNRDETEKLPGIECVWIEIDAEGEISVRLIREDRPELVYVLDECLTEAENNFIREVVSYYAEA